MNSISPRSSGLNLLVKWSARLSSIISSTFLSAFFSFLCQVLLARNLRVAEYGFIVVALSMANICQSLSNVGCPPVLIQSAARDGDTGQRWIRAAIAPCTVATILAFVGSMGYLLLSSKTINLSLTVLVLCYLPLLLCQPVVELSTARAQIRGKYHLMSLWQLLIQGSRIAALGILVLFDALNFWSALIAYALTGAAATLLASFDIYTWVTSDLEASRKSDRVKSATIVAMSYPYALIVILSVGISQLSVLILNALCPGSEAALFSLASLFISAAFLIPAIIYMKILLPYLTAWFFEDRPKFLALFQIGMTGMFCLGLAGTIFVFFGAQLIVDVLFGTKYPDLPGVLQIYSFAIFVRLSASPCGSLLFLSKSIKEKVYYNAASGAVFLSLTVLLAPRYGAVGAAYSALASEMLLATLSIFGAKKVAPDIKVFSFWNIVILRRNIALFFSSRLGNSG